MPRGTIGRTPSAETGASTRCVESPSVETLTVLLLGERNMATTIMNGYKSKVLECGTSII